MAPSTDAQLKNRIQKHGNNMEKMKKAKELNGQNCQAIQEHLKLVQKALSGMEKENNGSRGAAVQQPSTVDIRILSATFDNIQL